MRAKALDNMPRKFFSTTFDPIPKRVFYPSWQGALWEQASQINALWVSEVTGQPRLYFGDLVGNIYAVDARTGELVWKTKPDPHPNATITATTWTART